MDKKEQEAKLAELKEELEKARSHQKQNEEQATGPYAEVEFEEEIRQLELEISALENKGKDL